MRAPIRLPLQALPLPALLLLAALTLAADGAHANVRSCQPREQAWEQIKRSAGPIEINSALGGAADKGCTDLAVKLLDAGGSLESRDRLGRTPLARAAKGGHTDLVELFLSRGAPVNARDLVGSTPLFLAAEEDNRAVVEVLLKHGADLTLPGRSGLTPLAAAAYMGNAGLVALLLDKGADPKAVDATGKSAICYAGGRGFPAIVRMLLERGVDVNTHYGNNLTALMWAAGHADEAGSQDVRDLMSLLIERGARLDDQDDRGRSALMIAAQLGHVAATDVLVEHGANKALKDKSGKTAQDLAAAPDLQAKLTVR
jgi:ankyrin repeat protein